MQRPILLFDVMETLVVEPFFEVACALTGLDCSTLLEQKHPTMWVDFERNLVTEHDYCARFFRDGRSVDRQALRTRLYEAYRWVDGMEPLIAELHSDGWPMHAFSNYSIWYQMIDEKLGLSRYLQWTFVSHRTGLRKPDPVAYQHVIDVLGVAPQECLFVDDRPENTRAAIASGMQAVVFQNADQLRSELANRLRTG